MVLLIFRCELPFESDNATYGLSTAVQNVSIPWDSFTKAPSSCLMYDANYTDEYIKDGVPANKTRQCDKWIFYHPEFKSSTVIEVRN